jgi:6-phosphofructokinase 2
MKPILTLTPNPAIDGACEAEVVRPIRKIRTTNETFGPGGGGINVARVIRELGGEAHALYLAGGVTGAALDELMDGLALSRTKVPIAEDTRIAQVVYERSSGLEYRFVPEGPHVSEAEWQAALDALAGLDFDWLVASGSLPPGVPEDFFARVAKVARAKGARTVLDTSGPALRRSVEQGGLYMIKPSHGEFETLIGRKLAGRRELEEAAIEFIAAGKVELLTVTLGRDGALLASREGALYLASPPVLAKSAVGAGDSFVAAMVLALARGQAVRDAFAYAVAAGTAAVLRHGPHLCDPTDVDRLYAELRNGA